MGERRSYIKSRCVFYGAWLGGPGLLQKKSWTQGSSDDWVQENPFGVMNRDVGLRRAHTFTGGRDMHEAPCLSVSAALVPGSPLKPVLPGRSCQDVLPAVRQTPSVTGQGKPAPASCADTHTLPLSPRPLSAAPPSTGVGP